MTFSCGVRCFKLHYSNYCDRSQFSNVKKLNCVSLESKSKGLNDATFR